MTTIGSVVPAVKTALIDLWVARSGLAEVQVRYDPPRRDADLRAPHPDGRFDAVWFDQTTSVADLSVLGVGVKFDETAEILVRVQSIRDDSAGTMSIVDTRAAEILGEIITPVTDDPSIGVTVAGWNDVEVRYAGYSSDGGHLGDHPGHGVSLLARFDVIGRRC